MMSSNDGGEVRNSPHLNIIDNLLAFQNKIIWRKLLVRPLSREAVYVQ